MRGEEGDDVIVGGNNPNNGTPNLREADYDWLYGGAGDDALFGQMGADVGMYFGGEGHDYIKGGSRGTDSKIWGGSGDDFIRSGEKHTGSVVVKAGKGDDIINETVYNDETDQFGVYRQIILGTGAEFIAKFGERMNAEEKFYGEQGDDKIWIGGKVIGNAFAHGGTGDDTIYGGY